MKKNAFTLIELAIVLVIIGLIVGGILTGQDLINSAKIRMTIKQKEAFETAVSVFRGKYNCLPGDCSNATTLGFTQDGSGDGKIVSKDDIANLEYDEAVTFWVHLSQAGLIDGNYTSTNALSGAKAGADGVTPKINLPGAIGGWVVWCQSSNSLNQTYPSWAGGSTLLGMYAGNSIPDDDDQYTPPINARYALPIDQKIDDGYPTTGAIRGAYGYAISTGNDSCTSLPASSYYGLGGAGDGSCVNGTTTPNTYNVAYVANNNCNLLFKTSF